MKKVIDSIKKFYEDITNTKEKKIIFGATAVVMILVIVGIFVCIFVCKKENNKNDLETKLTALGKDFYENFYYDLVVDSHGIDQISKFSTVGIKANLNALEKYNSDNEKIIKKFINSDTKKKCNKDNTKVIIYPKDPYKKDDYRIEIQLDCGFETKEK